MKRVFIFILFGLSISTVFAQQFNARFTHEIEYVIPSRNSNDTITIAFDQSGRYLWTKFDVLAKELSKSIFKGLGLEDQEFDSNIIFDSEQSKIHLDITIGKNQFYFGFNLMDIIPMKSSNGFDEVIELNSIKMDSTFTLQNKTYPKYMLTPSSEPDSSIIAAFDESQGIDMSILIKNLIALIVTKTESAGSITLNLPSGLILYIQDDRGNDIIRAIRSTTINKTLDVNYSFKISE